MQVIKSPLTSVPLIGPDNMSVARPIMEALRWVIVGDVKTTKTHLLASIPDCLVLDIEDKMRHIAPADRKASYMVPRSFEELEGIIDWLCRERASLPYKIVAIDTVDEMLHSLVIPGLSDKILGKSRKGHEDIRDYGSSKGGSKGWDIVNTRVIGYLRRLYLAGYGWISIGHLKDRSVGDQKVKVVAINDGIKGGLYRSAEVIGVTKWKQLTVKVPTSIPGPGGKTVTFEKETVQATPIIEISTKLGDSDVVTGSNVNFPSEVVLTRGNAWESLRSAYEGQ